jgi:glutamine cyclotransferase
MTHDPTRDCEHGRLKGKCDVCDLQAEVERLNRVNAQLVETLNDIAYGLEKSRIWGGMDWSYHPMHPVKYLPLRDKARAALAKARGETK